MFSTGKVTEGSNSLPAVAKSPAPACGENRTRAGAWDYAEGADVADDDGEKL